MFSLQLFLVSHVSILVGGGQSYPFVKAWKQIRVASEKGKLVTRSRLQPSALLFYDLMLGDWVPMNGSLMSLD
ncbi:hypothetical protein SLEP1_g31585 [Rubroshorea leprosula]|uniref:Uncharacterized protein n=1 Tax=Rubroshorea leprosula TaxID=152421 RepID=A0AAV5K3T1_9ROSI|nr:hypothetical protein SLEP1_g31585 [Rubroshorea leprosula]